MALIYCKMYLILTWPANCFVIDNALNNQVPTFALTDTKLYVPVVTLSTQDDSELLEQLNFNLFQENN